MTDEQKQEVEKLVNEIIEKDLPVHLEEMTLEEAKGKGAMGVFESKYGEKVKVYTIGDNSDVKSEPPFSREICAGPHAEKTGELGHFKITKEDGIVFSLTFLSCLIFSLDIAFYIGIIISIVSYLRKAAEPFLMEYAFNASGRLTQISPKEKAKKRVAYYWHWWALFFGVVDLLQSAIQKAY